MKQRLLLALLMLLTSAGFMKVDGQTIVLAQTDQEETVTVTFTSSEKTFVGDNVTGKTASYPKIGSDVPVVSPDGSTASYTFKTKTDGSTTLLINNAVPTTSWGGISLTIEGKVNQFITTKENLPFVETITYLKILSTELTDLNLAYASKLLELNVSGCTKLATINNIASASQLATLNASGCGFVKLMDISSLAGLKVLNLSYNQLEGFIGSFPTSLETVDLSGNKLNITENPWNLTSLVNLTSLSLDGNTIRDVSVVDKCSVDFGTQDFTGYSLTDGALWANKDLDLNTDLCGHLVTGKVTIVKAESWKKLNDKTGQYDIDATAEAHTVIPDNKVVYRFYDAQNVYVDGDYECVLVSDKDYKYRVHFTVDPAKVTLTKAELLNGAVIKVFNNSDSEIEFQGANTVSGLKQGENYKIDIDFTNAPGYELSTFDIKGLKLIDGSVLTKRPIKCVVAATYGKNGDVEPYVGAKIVGTACKVTYTTKSSSDRGVCQVYKADSEEKYTIPVASETELAYGTKIRILLTPRDPKFTPSVTINGTTYNENNGLQELGENGQYFVDVTVDKNMNITASFGDKTSVDVGVILNGEELASSTDPLNSLTVTIFGSGLSTSGSPINKSSGAVELIPGVSYQLKTVIGSSVSSTYYIKYILVGGLALDVKREVAANSDDIYTAEFIAPSVDADICIVTSKLVSDWTIIPSLLDPSETDEVQTSIYEADGNGNGRAYAFKFKTNPEGLEKYVTVQYSIEGKNQWSTDAPTSVGTYDVQIVANSATDPKKDGYLPLQGARAYKLKIKQATPTFTQVPVVTLSDDKYVITNATNLEGLDGSFNIGTPTESSSHVVKFDFIPEGNTNYGKVAFAQEVKVDNIEVKKQSVSISLPSDGSLSIEKVMNADAVSCVKNSNDTYGPFVGKTELYIYVRYPIGVNPSSVRGQLQYQKGVLTEYANGNYSLKLGHSGCYVKAFKYTVPDDAANGQGETIAFSIDNAAQLTKEYQVEFTPKVYSIDYTGTPQTLNDFVMTNLVVKKADGTPVQAYDATNNTGYSISFNVKGNSTSKINGYPVNAGTYEMVVNVPAAEGHKSKSYTCNEFTINKATPKANDLIWPTALPILKGDDLSCANLVGGVSTMVPGSFQWKNNSLVPQDGQTCPVEFVPTDKSNYNSIGDKATEVTVLDITIPVLRVETPMYGTITVKDGDGNLISSGSDISTVKTLVITATPAQYFTFGKLVINGKEYTTQTVTIPVDGTSPVKVSAEFKHIDEEPEIDENSRYTVNVTKVLRGAVIDKPGANSVKRGESFSFSVATLAADASKVVVKVDGVTIKPVSGKYTITNITENKEVSVTLANPTPIKVTVPTEYKNKGGYLMGRVKISGPSDGKYYYNDQITLVAFPESNVHFDGWTGDLTGLTQIKEVVLTKDLTAGAKFSGTPTGIEDIMAASITTGKGCVWVRGIANADVTIVSIAGRVQAQERISGDTRIDVPAGIYVVVLESGSDVKRVKVIVK